MRDGKSIESLIS